MLIKTLLFQLFFHARSSLTEAANPATSTISPSKFIRRRVNETFIDNLYSGGTIVGVLANPTTEIHTDLLDLKKPEHGHERYISFPDLWEEFSGDALWREARYPALSWTVNERSSTTYNGYWQQRPPVGPDSQGYTRRDPSSPFHSSDSHSLTSGEYSTDSSSPPESVSEYPSPLRRYTEPFVIRPQQTVPNLHIMARETMGNVGTDPWLAVDLLSE